METNHTKTAAVIGAGPAGLMAAETLAAAGVAVTVFERMPSPGRKLLMAGRGGLNLTHSEPFEAFAARYGAAAGWMRPYLEALPPPAVTAWCEGLGQPTFIGSSGRVFPKAMKASPLLRAWLRRLDGLGVRLVTRAGWTGWDASGALSFADGTTFAAGATVLGLGGASWPRLGSDGGWTALLPDVAIVPLKPANGGFTVAWSRVFRDRHAGQPLKRIAVALDGETVRGEAMITAQGIEGGAVYAVSAAARAAIERDGVAVLRLDLRPDLTADALTAKLAGPRGGASLSTFLRKRAGLAPVAIGLVQEALHAPPSPPLGGGEGRGEAGMGQSGDAGTQANRPDSPHPALRATLSPLKGGEGSEASLSALIKALPLRLTAPFDIARAISTAGGIARDELDAQLMLRRRPGVFAAGEMIDWEAPTGGYLLQGCMATGAAAGRGAAAWLARGTP